MREPGCIDYIIIIISIDVINITQHNRVDIHLMSITKEIVQLTDNVVTKEEDKSDCVTTLYNKR